MCQSSYDIYMLRRRVISREGEGGKCAVLGGEELQSQRSRLGVRERERAMDIFPPLNRMRMRRRVKGLGTMQNVTCM